MGKTGFIPQSRCSRSVRGGGRSSIFSWNCLGHFEGFSQLANHSTRFMQSTSLLSICSPKKPERQNRTSTFKSFVLSLQNHGIQNQNDGRRRSTVLPLRAFDVRCTHRLATTTGVCTARDGKLQSNPSKPRGYRTPFT